MLHKFARFEIDEARRELRAGGRVLQVQPRVFELLAYLARNRERVVPKDELLDAVWPGVIVADGSLQRAISLGRSVLAEAGAADAIRTFSRQGYRLVGECAESSAASSVGAGPPMRPLLADVWARLNKSGITRADLELADEACKLATQLERTDPDGWAAWSQVDTWFVYHNFDASTQRREAARNKAARALQLGPDSYEARLAHACFLVRCGRYFRVSVGGTEAESLLRQLLEERPEEPRALFALAVVVRNQARYDEALELFDRMAAIPEFSANALSEKGWVLAGFMCRYAEAAKVADKAVALEPGWINLGLQIYLAQIWFGDTELAKRILLRIPAALLLEDWSIHIAQGVYRWRREPAEMLRVLEDVPRDWIASNGYTGPKRLLTGNAHVLAGRPAAAAIEWHAALVALDRHLEIHPHEPELHYRKGVVLSRLGLKDDAVASFDLYRAYGGGDNSYAHEVPESLWLGDLDQAVLDLERWVESGYSFLTVANFRLNPEFDPLRELPRFKKLVARLERSPAHTPKPRRS